MENVARGLLERTNDFEGASPVVDDVEGMSSPRMCRLLNALVAELPEGEAYLEIGSWKGLTLLSAARHNQDKKCIACDKFRFWGRYTGLGASAELAFRKNVEHYRGECAEIEFHKMDSDELFSRELVRDRVGVYFFDGDHSFEGTYDGIMKGAKLLADEALVLVDDYNDRIIRGATLAALEDAGLEVTWSRRLEGDQSDHGFWNGLGVFHVRRASAQPN